ncbi:MAG: hypothetical protein AMXMBFR84_43610 [Candidatus Hydrogenedentota bacterium]
MLFLLDNLKRELLFRKGTRFAALGECDRALRYFDAVLESSPTHGLAHANRGYCLAHMGKRDEAIKAYIRAAELDRDDPRHAFYAGCLHLQQGKKDAAADSFNQALFIDPEFKEAEEALASVTGRPVAPRLAPALKPAPVVEEKAKPGQAEALVAKGYELFEAGQFRDALKAWDESLALGYKTASLHNNRAAVLLELRDFSRAVDACDEALKIDPAYNIARMTRAEVYLAQGKVGAAQQECAHLRKAAPDMADALEAMIREANIPAEKQA